LRNSIAISAAALLAVLIKAFGGRSAASVIAIVTESLARRRHVTEDAATAGIQSRECKWPRGGW